MDSVAAGALARLVRPVRGRLLLGVALAAVSAVSGLVPFVAVAEVARLLLADGEPDRTAVWGWAAAGAAGALGRFLLFGLAGLVNHGADVDFQYATRSAMARRLARVPLGWFGGRGSGAVKKALDDDVAAMHHLVAHAAADLASGAALPVAAVAYLVTVDWRMTLVTVAVVPAGLICMALAMHNAGERMAAYETAQRRVANAVVAYADGMPVVKLFGRGRRAFEEYAAAVDAFSAVHGAWVASTRRASAAGHLVLSPVTVLTVVLAAGVPMVLAGSLPAVDLLPFLLVGVAIPAPYLAIGYGVYALHTARQAAGNVAAVLATAPLPVAERPRRPDGHDVVFEDVVFGYDDGPPVLDGVSFTMAPGTVTALVGPSGSGKTTIARLLPRFYDVRGGAVRVGGVDVRELAPAELLRMVAVVFQDVRVLRDTVAGNIRLGRPDATNEDVVAAARAAQLHDVVAGLPRGYDTVLGEHAALSGGELQRVTIARAILQDAPIVVLDEATAFADPASEAAVQDALAELAVGRTVLVIAHRLHTVAEADRILVVEGGRVTESGDHARLLAAGGRYAAMWAAQERDRARDDVDVRA